MTKHVRTAQDYRCYTTIRPIIGVKDPMTALTAQANSPSISVMSHLLRYENQEFNLLSYYQIMAKYNIIQNLQLNVSK